MTKITDPIKVFQRLEVFERAIVSRQLLKEHFALHPEDAEAAQHWETLLNTITLDLIVIEDAIETAAPLPKFLVRLDDGTDNDTPTA